MDSPWVAVDLAADPVARARLLRRAHEAMLSGSPTPVTMRDVVARSWARCEAAGVHPDRPAPLIFTADAAASRFSAHPLAAVTPIVRDLLDTVSGEARHLVALSDAAGILLWADGHPRMLEAAAAPHFTPGALGSEPAFGTNAIGTALALDHPVQIFSAEHYNRLLHGWTCAAAPIHDPASGAVLGTLDVSSSFRKAHPHTLALVSAAARAAESHLARDRARREAELIAAYVDRIYVAGRRPSALVAGDGRGQLASPRGWLGLRIAPPAEEGEAVLADGTQAVFEKAGAGAWTVWGVRRGQRRAPRRTLRIEALAVQRPVIQLAGRSLPLTARHAELVVVLALHPAGLSANDLALALYGARASRVSARAEVARLRRLVGGLVAAQPYRLDADVFADFEEIARLMSRGRIAAAVRRYPGPLLPESDVPAIVACRDALETALGEAVRTSGDPGVRRRWEQRRHRGSPAPPATSCNPPSVLANGDGAGMLPSASALSRAARHRPPCGGERRWQSTSP
jgi:hypothetical protein